MTIITKKVKTWRSLCIQEMFETPSRVVSLRARVNTIYYKGEKKTQKKLTFLLTYMLSDSRLLPAECHFSPY